MTADYLMAGQQSELARLQLQSRVWEPAGQALLAGLPSGSGLRVIDVGCGAMGWLRALSVWVGPSGTVVGTDINRDLLAAAGAFVAEGAMANVELVDDDLFASALPSESFDLVHARFQLAPIGRAPEQLASYRRLVRPGGWLVLEDPDAAIVALQPACARRRASDRPDPRCLPSGRRRLRCRPLAAGPSRRPGDRSGAGRPCALSPGHPYLRLPLQFASSLTPRIEPIIGADALAAIRAEVEEELADAARWGTTFTLIQSYGRVPG
jgi:SAM-dependent methyltransferase